MEADARLASGGRGGNSTLDEVSSTLAVEPLDPSAQYTAHSGSAPDDVAIEILERHVEFMTFFYQHLAASPPHGPFRYYAAITLVERARKRYGKRREFADLHGAGLEGGHRAGAAGTVWKAEVASEASGLPSQGGSDVVPASHHHSGVLKVLNVRNILALIDQKYNTRHLSSWPLLYVPAEVHATDLQRQA